MSGFQIKDFASIVASQINHARAVTDKVTDFAPGSVARTLIEAPAVEIEELYLQMFLGLRDAIPVATFKSFGFEKLPAKRAFGFVSVSTATPLTSAISIPAGTVFSTAAGANYSSTLAVTWAAGQTLVRVPVQAGVTGLAGNVAAGVITLSALFPSSSGFTVSNALIESGRDAETDSEREVRFADYVRSLSRGTVDACLYAAKAALVLDADGNIDQFVTRAGIVETPGRVSIYVYSNRGVASAQLLAAGQLLLDGYRDDASGAILPGFRPAGVRVDVLPMSERAISMGLQVEMLDGYELTSLVIQSMTDIYSAAIRAVPAGETLYLGTLIEELLAAPGVQRIVPGYSGNITCGQSEALTPGLLTITAL
jgi:Baseplate J-like protein